MVFAVLTYCALLFAFWIVAGYFHVEVTIGGHFPSAFASFALLLAPFWFFGFEAAGLLRKLLNSRRKRIIAAAIFLFPYLVYALPRGEFRISVATAILFLSVGLTALFEFSPSRTRQAADWRDFIVLALLGLTVNQRWLGGAWAHPGLGGLAKLLLTDIGLYLYLVVRELDGVGYDFTPRMDDVKVGLREWALFAPIAIVLGLALGFLHFHAQLPSPWAIPAAWLLTFVLVAVPEELFFRGLMQNLLERRFGGRAALIATSIIFGLSHYNKRAVFNWRYVLLATIAGIFYGRAWRYRRRIFTSAITHTTVDVLWSTWFR
ncbi:MAG: Abortive infection protein [Candidatus Angelobacter sp.]|jgi:membrane protease YdiL (CAAX protease family)|nr:Abortive infection protein [Candidatus Angelobacter sp.]